MPKKSQIDKFREVAREIEANEDEAMFDSTLRRIAKGDPKAADEMAEMIGQKDHQDKKRPGK